MQSFRERSTGYHSNQPCYQQEPHELSRLETYRQHPHHPHPQHPHPGPGQHPGPGPGLSRPGYDIHPLASPTSMTPTGGGSKDCYSPQAFASFPGNGGGNGNGNGASTKKSYRGSKAPTQTSGQHLQGPGGFSNHMGPGSYSAQYLSEGHLQQKWDDSAQLSQYDQDIVARMEASTPTPGSSQYMDQNLMGHSQTQCHQPSTPAYTSPHHQPHASNPPPSPLMYPQSHLHYPQHSPSPSPYMEKCNPIPHCYKGYNMPPTSQYSRQMNSLKQGPYRQSQNSYSYQQPASRGYDPHTPLQALTNPQESHNKYQHYSQAQQNYCLSDMPVRSPDQYYQTCSPSSSHSPARSVGRSPSYSSTPSPLMTNPESFQYTQPSMTPSSSSASSAGMQEQGGSSAMLMPPRSHPSPNVSHAAPHSYTTTPQLSTMKERFSEKLLSNPSLWSLNALTSQVENISNNVQQLLLSEALVGNKKSGKRSSGGSNSSVGSGTSSKKSEEYKSPLYTDGSGGGIGGGPMPDPFSTPQHQTHPMELHEGGYSSSSDEQLERGYYYCSQGRSPAQALNNTGLSLETASSCSITSPDDMSIRSGDSGVHNLTPDPARCTSVQGADGMSTPVKSIGDERSPTSITISSPLKQERDSPPDIESIDEPVKENYEESTWTDKSPDKNEVTTVKTTNLEGDADMTKTKEKLEQWTAEENSSGFFGKEGKAEKSYCYDTPVYHEVQSKYDLKRSDSLEQSPSGLSSSKHQEVKSETLKSESPTPSESSVKTLPFVSRGDIEPDQYFTEKEDSSESTSPTHQIDDESLTEKMESREIDVEQEDEAEDIQKEEPQSLSPPLSTEVSKELKEGETVNQSTEDHINNADRIELYSRPEIQSTNHSEDFAPVHPNTAVVADVSTRESAIGDTAPQPESAMPVFSSLNDKAAPAPAHARDHIDHCEAKVLEPDSPQLPGKSILPSAPSWADTPPSPKKGDEDIEPGISCASAVTPSTKPEPLAPTAQPRTYGRKYARGRRRFHSGLGLKRQLSLETEGEKVEESVPSQKPCMPASKTGLISDQTDLVHQEPIVSPTPKKIITDVLSSRMCTRSFNAPELPPKDKTPMKRKPGPKPGPKLKPGPKPEAKGAVKLRPGPKPGSKSGPKTGLKPGPNEPEVPPKIEIPVKQKPGPKPRAKPGPKPGLKPAPKPEPKPEDILPPTNSTSAKATVGRPKGSGSKIKSIPEVPQPSEGMQSRRRRAFLEAASAENQDVKQVNVEEKSEVKALQRENKNMILRSRKPSQEKATKEKIDEETIDAKIPADLKVSDLKVEDTVQAEQTLTPLSEVNNTNSLAELSEPPKPSDTLSEVQPAEDTTSLKRKTGSPPPPSIPVKKKRGPKPKSRQLAPQPLLLEEDISTPTEVAVMAPKRKQSSRKRSSPSSSSTKEILPNNCETDISGDAPVAPPQCPTKTKVLPPRKGRGQKYEALVQKMTSPSTKKHQILQIESSLTDDLATKALSQNSFKGSDSFPNNTEIIEEVKNTDIKVDEDKEQEEPIRSEESTKHDVSTGAAEEEKSESDGNELAHKEEPNTRQNSANVEVRAEWTQETACVSIDTGKSAKAKKKRWAIVESTNASQSALDTDSLIVTTPRLAKQRAIKNNHEMHLKQRRKKRKEGTEAVSEANTETNVETTEQQERVEMKADSDCTVPVPMSTKEVPEPLQVSSTELTEKPKRGRKPSLNKRNKKQGKASLEQTPDRLIKVHKKPGPKPGMKDALEVIEAVVRAAGCEQAEKEEREKEEKDSGGKEESCIAGPVVTVSEKESEIICVKRFRRRPVIQNSKLSFCPYVRLSNSRDFSSWCAIVNKPEDAVVFQRRRKKGILRMRNPFTVAKGMPHSAAMLQGPLVNKSLMDRCLSCSLCGKPANYRDLGDLCGPFYAEDDIPRKILTSGPSELIREITGKASTSRSSINSELGIDSKDEGESDTKIESTTDSLTQEGSSRHRRYRRPEGSECIIRRGGLRRVTLRERFRRIQLLKTTSPGTSNSKDSQSIFQKLQEEAEAKEHWAHENCAIWTKGVVMVAGRLYGLKEAANTSGQTSCYKCQIVGASLSCCWRGCSNKYHYVCAKEIGCTFHEDDFSIKCPKHEDL